MANLVGYAKCPECGFEKAAVFENKRKKLFLNCRKSDGGEGCSTFHYQSKSAQSRLRLRTTFISENPAPAVALSKMEPKKPASTMVSEELQEPTSEPVKPARKKWGFFK